MTTAFRVWHVANIPGKPFHVEVESLSKAKLVLDTLGFYDLHLEATGVRGDYSNVGGIQVWEDGEWVDHEDYDGEADEHEVRLLPDGSISQLKFDVNAVPPSAREQHKDESGSASE